MAMKNWLPGLRLRAQGLRVWVLRHSGFRGLGVQEFRAQDKRFRSSEFRVYRSGLQGLGP